MSGDRFNTLLTRLTNIAVLVVAGIVVLRVLSPSRGTGAPVQAAIQPERDLPDWQVYAQAGHRLGSSSAQVTLVEFGDFQCPACGALERGPLKAIRAQFRDSLAIVFRHAPLAYHRLAYPAARAAECAGDQGRFGAIHDLFYAKQDSLGIISFDEFAQRAGVPDADAFHSCMQNSNPVQSIEQDILAGKRLPLRGTPTLLIAGKLLTGAADSARLASLVRAALDHGAHDRVDEPSGL